MAEKCPTCERVFEGISDYPSIYVAKFERMNIPEKVVLPDYDHTIYVGPKSECNNPKPPQEVLDFFKGNKKAEQYDFGEFVWYKQGTLDSGCYRLERKDAKGIIMAQLAPYFDTLDGLVGKEVPTADILPKFEGFRYGHVQIPETRYDLTLEGLDGQWGVQMLKQNNLPIPNLETPRPTRKLAFVITRSGGGSLSEVHFLATVGGLAYEGKLKGERR